MAFTSSLATAQEAAGTPAAQENATEDRDDGGEWGWIGLLGLAGLIGLKRRDDRVTTR
jgi:MYXO-CTERM domain-containing protein